MKKHFFLLALACIFGCNKKQNSEENKEISKEVAIASFALPEEITGCVCQFATNTQEYQNGNFIYVDDYGNTAYLNINGKKVEIPMEEENFDPQDFSKIIENEYFSVVIKTQRTADDTEKMRYIGTMTITEKATKKHTTTPIWGECGCP